MSALPFTWKQGRFQPHANLTRMPDSHDHLLRTQRERRHNPGDCGFPVTSRVTEPNPDDFLIEHDLRANASRLSRGKTGFHFSGSCSPSASFRAFAMTCVARSSQTRLSDQWSPAFCSRTDPELWSTECIGLYHHLTNVVAVGALERAEIKTHAYGHDVRKHHLSMTFWADTALDLNVNVVGHRTNFWHHETLTEAGAQRSQSPAACLLMGR